MSDPSGLDIEDDAAKRRRYGGPHSGKRPIPTIQKYRERKRELQSRYDDGEDSQSGSGEDSKPKRVLNSVKAIIKDEDVPRSPKQTAYPSTNRNYEVLPGEDQADGQDHDDADSEQDTEPTEYDASQPQEQEKSATEAVASAIDPREKRKIMKKSKRHGRRREVTDPVTHLPIVIHDQTDKDLASVPLNEPEPGADHTTATGLQGASKSDKHLDQEQRILQRGFNGVQRLFPPPDFNEMKRELSKVYQQALYWGLVTIGTVSGISFLLPSLHGRWFPQTSTVVGFTMSVLTTLITASGMGMWVSKKVNEIFDDEVWDAARSEENRILDDDTELPESVQWLNRLLASVWPLVNPDLFSSLIDMVEDIMQASLPKTVRMVSVDDLGQGNESIRILGMRWIPTGAASRTVGPDGKLETRGGSQSDRTDPQNAQDEDVNGPPGTDPQAENNSKQNAEEQVAIREGFEAEEGDFLNLELAISYRSRSSGKSMKAKAKNAHMYLKFYLPGGVAFPVWVELRSFVATMRVRLQLTPDPPFISLCTLTFLGQPKATLACVPLSRHSPNLMDMPVISSFVQSAIDAALAEYVAPKSLTLNLKDMLVGADYKKDTISRGVVWIFIKKARGFKQGDAGIGPLKEGSSDAYVTVSWGKFGKPVASTRIIEEEQNPDWNEYASILVTMEELNAEERLRLQLWDSDKYSADDDLGRVELDLKSIMNNPKSHNRIQDREDGFTGQDSDEKMPGTLYWSVGYFSKAGIQPKQLEQQTVDDHIRSKDQLLQHVSEMSERKLREAGKAPDDDELRQQKSQDYKELVDDMIISAPPLTDLVSGILGVQVHNITGLEIQNLQKKDKNDNEKEDHEDETEREDGMPDSYCTIILNHKKIYRTRTKPKNSKPFFNAGTERFIRNWRTTEIIVAVWDSRERESDPLIGLVYLPLAKLFEKRSQVMENYPLVGGIGYGRARISLIWRSVELKLPQNLLGWDYGTLEIRGAIKPKEGLSPDLKNSRLKLRTNLGHTKLYWENEVWKLSGKSESDSTFLAVGKRYSSPLVIEFRQSHFGPDKSAAFAVLWLQDVVEEEDQVKVLQVWKGGKDNLKRAESCYGYQGLKENENPLGEIEVSLKLWRGLSGFHKNYASKTKSGEMRQVMECLDTISDESLKGDYHVEESESTGDSDSSKSQNCDNKAKKKLKVHTNDSSSSSDEDNDGSSSSNLSISAFSKVKKIMRNPVDGGVDTATSVLAPGHNDSEDGSRGIRGQLRDYKDHHKELHRKHRGVFQWRAVREADHLGGKLSRLNPSRIFHHGEKEASIETEV